MISIKRLALILVYANAMHRSYALHADLTRPTQYERDCWFTASIARGRARG